MKNIPYGLGQLKGITGLLGATAAFVVSLLPLGTFVGSSSPHIWSQTEVSLSVVLLIGTIILIVTDAHHLRLRSQGETRKAGIQSDLGHLVGFILYFSAVGYMILGARNIIALRIFIYASAAAFCANRLRLLYPSHAEDYPSSKDWRLFMSIFIFELIVFGLLLWHSHF